MKKILYISFILISIISFLFSLTKIINSIAPDFSVFYYGAKDLILGSNPYQNDKLFTGINYPPLTLLFYMPLTLLSYNFAQFIWLMITLICLLGSIFLSLKILKIKITIKYFLLVLSLSVLAFPIKFTFGMGQSNILALFLLLLSFYNWKKDKNIIGGIMLGICISIKPILGFFLLFFVIYKAKKLIIISLLTLSFFIMISIVYRGIDLYQYYIWQIIPPLLNPGGREVYYNQGLMAFISRHVLIPTIRISLNFFASLLLITISLIGIYKNNKSNIAFAIFFPMVLLLDTLSWQHHFVWLLFPFIIIYNYIIKMQNNSLKYILLFAYILVAINFKQPTFFWSHVFLGTIIIWILNIYLLKRSDDPT
ncbi:MAG: glycosyltransferase family 87 protein [Candidatus Gottesmanbacteria bacterium]